MRWILTSTVTIDHVNLIIVTLEDDLNLYIFVQVMVTAVVDHDGEADGDVSLRYDCISL